MDERLRALERSSALDGSATWARLRVLARTRDRRELWLEVARLARQGDVAARHALACWSPLGPLPLEPPATPAEGARWSASSLVFESPALDPLGALAVTDDDLLLGYRGVGQGWGRLVALAPGAGAQRWTADTSGPATWRGDDLAHASTSTGEVVLRDAETGAVLAQMSVGERIASLAIEGDRGVLKLAVGDTAPRTGRLLCFDAGAAFGTVLWQADLALDADVRLGGGRCLVHEDRAVRAHGLEDGAVAWERRAEANGQLEGALLLRDALSHLDAAGILLHGITGRQSTTLAIDPATGATRWARTDDVPESAVAGPTLVVVHPHSGDQLTAYDRETGDARWTARVPAAAFKVGERLVVAARHGAPPPGGAARSAGVRHATVLDARSGATLLDADLDAHGSPALTILAGPTTGWVVASTPGRLSLVRLRCG